LLKDAHGAIVNVPSLAAIAALPIMPSYAIADGWRQSIVKVLEGQFAEFVQPRRRRSDQRASARREVISWQTGRPTSPVALPAD
jgi:hypothetical protein